jgi:hypothetical protein
MAHRPANEAPEAITRTAPPLPKSLRGKLLDYYPDGSKRAHEQGRVVMNAEIGPSGRIVQPISIDAANTDAAARLVDAASKILGGSKFEVGDRYKTRVTVSVVFELVPCGSIVQAESADYRISICLDPSPYADVNFAEHPPAELESKIDKVLLHGNLADIDFLEETLGVRFWVTPPVPSPYAFYMNGKRNPNPRVLVTPVFVPTLFHVQGFSYQSWTDTDAHISSFYVRFSPVDCPDIRLWSARLKLHSTSSLDPHGYGQGADFQSGGEHGIAVSAFYHSGGGCEMSLSQRKEMGEPFASHVDRGRISPARLVRGLGAMIASGDIRNVVRAERTLGVNLTTAGPGEFGVSYELKSVIPGIDPEGFEFSANDTGRENASVFFYVPPRPANRTARLDLMIDVYHLCVRRGQISSELHRRGIHFRHITKNGEDRYIVGGKNEIVVQMERFGDCMIDIKLTQTTDVRHAIVPVNKNPISATVKRGGARP